MRRLPAWIAWLVLGVTSPASSQRSPAATFGVDVRPTVGFRAGNVVRVSYSLRLTSTARDSLSNFAVLSPVPVRVVTAPVALAGSMLLGTREGERDAARWSFLVAMPRNRQSVGALAYEAIGLPGIVHYRARRHVPVREAGPRDLIDEPPPLQFDVADRDQIVGATIGVVKMPTDQTPAGLAAWLRGQLTQACALGWINTPETCDRLLAAFDARGARALAGKLDAERGAHVNENAYILLTTAMASLVSHGSH